MRLPLSELVLDYTVYPRTNVSEEHVRLMVETLLSGRELPPIVACATTKRIVDGFHRYHAYQKIKAETVPVELRVYASEVDFYKDAVALNVGHGRPLSRYELKRVVAKCEKLGLQREEVAELIRVRPATIDEMRREVAFAGGEIVPVKRGLEALQGQKLTPRQEKTLRSWGGMNAVFYVDRLIDYLQCGLPVPASLANRLDRLVELWIERRQKATA